eukprot:gene8919-biopygen16678
MDCPIHTSTTHAYVGNAVAQTLCICVAASCGLSKCTSVRVTPLFPNSRGTQLRHRGVMSTFSVALTRDKLHKISGRHHPPLCQKSTSTLEGTFRPPRTSTNTMRNLQTTAKVNKCMGTIALPKLRATRGWVALRLGRVVVRSSARRRANPGLCLHARACPNAICSSMTHFGGGGGAAGGGGSAAEPAAMAATAFGPIEERNEDATVYVANLDKVCDEQLLCWEKWQRTRTGRRPHDRIQRNGRGPEADRTRARPFLPGPGLLREPARGLKLSCVGVPTGPVCPVCVESSNQPSGGPVAAVSASEGVSFRSARRPPPRLTEADGRARARARARACARARARVRARVRACARHVLSCPVLSCPVLSCHVMSCHVMSCHVMSCHVMSCHVMSCHVMSCHVMSCHVMSCHVMSCHVTPRHATSRHVTSRNVMSTGTVQGETKAGADRTWCPRRGCSTSDERVGGRARACAAAGAAGLRAALSRLLCGARGRRAGEALLVCSSQN